MDKKGFTLVELVVVFIILVALSSIIAPMVTHKKSKEDIISSVIKTEDGRKKLGEVMLRSEDMLRSDSVIQSVVKETVYVKNNRIW
jgi:prepilin-type N-terminal cleavage/methylation domain-containing protein